MKKIMVTDMIGLFKRTGCKVSREEVGDFPMTQGVFSKTKILYNLF